MENKTVKKEKKQSRVLTFIGKHKFKIIAGGLAALGIGFGIKRYRDGKGKTDELGSEKDKAPAVVDPGHCRVDSVVNTGFNSVIVVENTTTNSDPECVNAGFYKVTPSGVDTVCETSTGDQVFDVKPGERTELEYSGRYGLYNRLRRGAERFHGTFAVDGDPEGALKVKVTRE